MDAWAHETMARIKADMDRNRPRFRRVRYAWQTFRLFGLFEWFALFMSIVVLPPPLLLWDRRRSVLRGLAVVALIVIINRLMR